MQPNYAPKSSIQDLHEDKQSSSKWGLMEEEKLRSSPGSAGKGNNKKMFPLANEDSNFFWPDTTDLFNLDSPRLQAPENLPTPITVFEIHTKTLISQHSTPYKLNFRIRSLIFNKSALLRLALKKVYALKA